MIKRLTERGIFPFFLVLLIALLIRVPALFYLPKIESLLKTGMLYDSVAWVNQWPVISLLLALLIVIVQAFFLNEICRNHGLVNPLGYLPAYFFIIVQSLYPENLLLSEYHLGNLLVFIGLSCFLQLKDGYSRVILFYGSLAFGVVVLIVPDHLMILLFILASVLVFKNIMVLDVLCILFGLVMPFCIVRSLAFIFNWGLTSIDQVLTTPINIQVFRDGIGIVIEKYALFLFLLLCILLGLFKQIGNYFQNNVEVRRSKLVVILFFTYSVLLMLLHWRELRSFHLLSAFPAAVFLSSFYTGNRIPWWKELLNLAIVLAVLYSLYGSFLVL